MCKYLSLDIGGTAIKYAVLDEEAVFTESGSMDTQAHLGGKKVVDNVRAIIDKYIKKYTLKAVSISTAGMVDTQKGEVFFAGETMPGYSHTEWKNIIEKEYGLYCVVENDVNCAAFAEFISGSGKDSEKMLCLTVGTGIGGSFISEKEVYHGANYSACEVGYMWIDGCEKNFQELCSTSTLCKAVAKKKNAGIEEWNGHKIFEYYKHGDEDCIYEVEKLCKNLSKGIANICYVLDPDTVVLGGGIMEQKDILKDLILKFLSVYLKPVMYEKLDVRFAAHGNKAGLLGAYYIARQDND